MLLLEPNYRNKYPPLGLMKLATYHRMLGDNVVFYKGNLKRFVVDELYRNALSDLYDVDSNVFWETLGNDIRDAIQYGYQERIQHVAETSVFSPLIMEVLRHYRSFYYHKRYFVYKKWDRVCVTTLFTFNWKVTIDTINFAISICKDISEVKVGGILASVVPEHVEKATGIKPHIGLLDRPGILDNNDLVIEEMPIDYSILDEIDYKYPEANAYYGYMTRGCIRKCQFCAVPKIEPDFISYITLNQKLEHISEKFGKQRNLLLLDNNVLASPQFPKIVAEIKEHGFEKGATYIEPNWLDISVRNLHEGLNDTAYIKKSQRLMKQLIDRAKGDDKQMVYDVLFDHGLLHEGTARKEAILKAYPLLAQCNEKYRNQVVKKRYVDFNQGIDARLINEENIQLLAELPIHPLRIAFDHWSQRQVYENAIRLAAEHGITHLSNYILFNYLDKPIEFYYRLRLNILLCEELGISIYSFPMKYHPIDDPDYFQNRDYIGKHWNKKFIRAVQSVLNSTKGKIGRSKKFFEKAFGKNEAEYMKILYMPERMIIYREKHEQDGSTEAWWRLFKSLDPETKARILPTIHANHFTNVDLLIASHSGTISPFLEFYQPERD